MRVYVPATLSRLAVVLERGSLEAEIAYAVTPGLREWYTEGDLEELEYAATTAAARASLRLIAAEGGPSRRTVLAAEVPDRSARPAPDVDRAAVRLAGPFPVSVVVSAHVDDTDAVEDVRRAVDALPASDTGDEDARFVVDGVEDHELGWYAAQELGALVALET